MSTFAPGCALLLFGIAFTARASAADTYSNVDVCQLMANPEQYDGKLITVRVKIDIGFEYFEMEASHCKGLAANPIWLEYARGLKQPTTWCCGDTRSRDPLAIKKDKSFREFDRYLRANHNGHAVYHVTATLSGRFDSAPAALCPDAKHLCPKDGGFGHFGGYAARMVIESASDVSAIRDRNF